MPLIAGFYRLGRAASWIAAITGVALILAAGLLTCADVVIRNLGFRGIIGMVDLTQLFVLAAASFVIPFAFFAQSHVAVDLLTQQLSPRANAAINLFSALLAIALIALIVRYGYAQAQLSIALGDRSQTLQMPISIYWALFVGGNALSLYAACAMALRHLAHVVTGRDPFPSGVHVAPQ
jgi:TRAP-type C4-dicarboxylate transport system permease small subunit